MIPVRKYSILNATYIRLRKYIHNIFKINIFQKSKGTTQTITITYAYDFLISSFLSV